VPGRPASTDRLVDEVAARQHGVVSRAQLTELGVGRGAVAHRLRNGRFHEVHRGVYRVGPVAGPRALEMAALLACGHGAALSHTSAAALWKLCALPSATAPVDVTVPRRSYARRSGIRVHRTLHLPPSDLTHVEGLALTGPARTLLDLSACESSSFVSRVLGEAFVQRLTTRAELVTLVSRRPKQHGAGLLNELLEQNVEQTLTRSEGEARFRALVDRARLPEPESNVQVEGPSRVRHPYH
jgi:predicted transcriptional regulator of viral defense system